MKTRAKRFVSALLAGVLCLSLLAGCASKKERAYPLFHRFL